MLVKTIWRACAKGGVTTAWFLILAACAAAQTAVQTQDAGPPDQGEVLTRGALHEAFAQAVTHDPKLSSPVAKAPPEPIQEVPPDQRPEGRNVQWIPGYWSYDSTRQDYIWISGVWREPPPGCQWVPGYWDPVQGGYQWVPGAWVKASNEVGSEPVYLPEPPASLENGPTSPQPRPDTTWTPGYWEWQNSGYVWRPGFWAAVQPNWVWMPAHYVPTPAGWLFVPGYWDWPLDTRGVMFAPVYYPAPVYAQPGFVFTPTVVIAAPMVTANLFVQVGTGQYFFGDYYGQTYVGMGISPWFSFAFATGPPVFYDPLFSYYSVVTVRSNPTWVAQVRQQYHLRVANPALRPGRTYVEERRRLEQEAITAREHGLAPPRALARPLHELVAEQRAGEGRRLVPVTPAERDRWRAQAAQLHNYREQRIASEQRGAAARRAGGRLAEGPRPMGLPRSPVAAHPHPALAQSASRTEHSQAHQPPQTSAPHAVPHFPDAANRAAMRGDSMRAWGLRSALPPSELTRSHGYRYTGSSAFRGMPEPRGRLEPHPRTEPEREHR